MGQERVQHSLLGKSLHWFFVLLFGYGVFKQIENKEQLNDLGASYIRNVFCGGFFVIYNVSVHLHEKKIQNCASFRDIKNTTYSSKICPYVDVFCSHWNCNLRLGNWDPFLAGL